MTKTSNGFQFRQTGEELSAGLLLRQKNQEIKMKTVEQLAAGDYVAFAFNYNNSEPDEIIVDNITHVYPAEVLVHFVYGTKSISEIILKTEILAIGNNESGEGRIEGWGGKYDVLKAEKLEKILEARKLGNA